MRLKYFLILGLPAIIVFVSVISSCERHGGGSFVDKGDQNIAPTAHAGENQTVLVGETVFLDGSGSHDPDNNQLQCQWSFVNRPPLSQAELFDANTVHPRFVPDVEGIYTVQLIVSDGKTQSQPSNVVIEALDFKAKLNVDPSSGTVPLDVIFYPEAQCSGGTIVIDYRIEFGDGTPDWTSLFPKFVHHTYNDEDTYEAVLTVENAKLNTATDTVEIKATGSPPVAIGEVEPSNGALPLTVNFFGDNSYDPDGSIALYEWDFDGDGNYDYVSDETGDTTHTFNVKGDYSAKLRVTDNSGLTDVADPQLTAVRVGAQGSPTAVAGVSRVSGVAPLTVNFYDDGSFDPNGSIALHEWDFDGDGAYDANGQTVTHTYYVPGTYYVNYRVTDSEALLGIDVIEVNVFINVTLSVSEDTIDFSSPPSSSSIETGMSGDTYVTIYLKDKPGNKVRTLVDNEWRESGNHSDDWDGMDDDGFPVDDGIYYAVIAYSPSGSKTGSKISYDLTYTTGGYQHILNQYAKVPNPSPFPFNPFNNEYLPIEITLPSAYEVSLHIGIPAYKGKVETLIDMYPIGKGYHLLRWHGYGTDQYGHSVYNENVTFGITGFTLPDNGIVVQGSKPTVSNFYADTNYFSPFNKKFGDPNAKIRIYFELSKLSDVFLNIFSLSDNSLVNSFSYFNLPAGTNEVSWGGKHSNGFYVPPGNYRATIKTIDNEGNTALDMHTLIKLNY